MFFYGFLYFSAYKISRPFFYSSSVMRFLVIIWISSFENTFPCINSVLNSLIQSLYSLSQNISPLLNPCNLVKFSSLVLFLKSNASFLNCSVLIIYCIFSSLIFKTYLKQKPRKTRSIGIAMTSSKVLMNLKREKYYLSLKNSKSMHSQKQRMTITKKKNGQKVYQGTPMKVLAQLVVCLKKAHRRKIR